MTTHPCENAFHLPGITLPNSGRSVVKNNLYPISNVFDLL